MNLLPIKSSWLHGAHYDAETQVLTVQMKSGTYTGKVPPAKFEAFAGTFQAEDSSGKHFNAHIRQHMTKKV